MNIITNMFKEQSMVLKIFSLIDRIELYCAKLVISCRPPVHFTQSQRDFVIEFCGTLKSTNFNIDYNPK